MSGAAPAPGFTVGPATPARPGRASVAAPEVAVAFSGGPDSLALLHVTCRAAVASGLGVLALHVHHNLLPEADGWLAEARALCRRWARRGWPLRLRWARLDGGPAPGESTEAWARRGRYAALAQLAREEGVDLVLLGQHRRDQAETVLLQALRGAGPAGLAAMPRSVQREGIFWARPWLERPREAIGAYLRRHRLAPVEDPSNADPAHARSRLRMEVWPPLTAAFPEAEAALAAVARRAQRADAALAELAALDLATLRDGDTLDVARWLALSDARRAVSLHAWLSEQPGVVAGETLVQRLLAEVPACRAGRWPAGPGRWCRLYRRRLRCVVDAVPAVAAAAEARPLDLRGPGAHAVPGWRGRIVVTVATQGGLSLDLLAAVEARPRQGGERFALSAAGLPRSLKKQFQARAVPEADRQGPLLWAGDRLLFVPALGIDARSVAPPGAPQLALRWRPDAHAGG